MYNNIDKINMRIVCMSIKFEQTKAVKLLCLIIFIRTGIHLHAVTLKLLIESTVQY